MLTMMAFQPYVIARTGEVVKIHVVIDWYPDVGVDMIWDRQLSGYNCWIPS